uniref:Pentatricopeptide repeat-containing protein n=1 Tax=Leersia perrieri TaxID=77586 RepID=A0A0D9WC90_9ORYZ
MPSRTQVSWNAVYVNAGERSSACRVFDQMPTSWSVLIVGYCKRGSMRNAHWQYGVGTYVDRKRIERNEKVLTALVDMHAKCGNVEEALSAFREIAQPDAYPYTALISSWSCKVSTSSV